MTVVLSGYYTALKNSSSVNALYNTETLNRFSYSTEVILGRKFNKKLSMQASAVWVHWNFVPGQKDDNDVFAVTTSGRYKFTKRTGVIAEYGYIINPFVSGSYYNPLNVGVEFETGGQVFQLTVGNSFGITSNQTLCLTDASWMDSGWRIGFNVSRSFYLGKRDKNNTIK